MSMIIMSMFGYYDPVVSKIIINIFGCDNLDVTMIIIAMHGVLMWLIQYHVIATFGYHDLTVSMAMIAKFTCYDDLSLLPLVLLKKSIPFIIYNAVINRL